MLNQTLSSFEEFFMQYLTTPNRIFLFWFFVAAFLLGYGSLCYRFYFIKNDKEDDFWHGLKLLDRVVISIMVGIISFVLVFIGLMFYIIVMGVIASFFKTSISSGNTVFNQIIFVIIAFVFLINRTTELNKNIDGRKYLSNLFDRKSTLGIILMAPIIFLFFQTIIAPDSVKLILLFLTIISLLIYGKIKKNEIIKANERRDKKMKFLEVWKNFAPGFVGGLTSAMMLAIILGQKPTNIGWFPLFFWVIGLFLFGVIMSWILLWKFR